MFYYCLVPCAGPSQPARRWGGVANTDTEPALTLRLALCLEPAVPPPRTLPSPTCCPPQVGNLGLLFMLLFFIYAALGVELFGKLGA